MFCSRGTPSESHGQNPVVTVLYAPSVLDSSGHGPQVPALPPPPAPAVSAEREQLHKILRTLNRKPRPESRLNCLMSAEFTRRTARFFHLSQVAPTARSNRGEYLWSLLDRSIFSINLYQMLFYKNQYDPGVYQLTLSTSIYPKYSSRWDYCKTYFPTCGAPWAAIEPRCNNPKAFKDFCFKGKARICAC